MVRHAFRIVLAVVLLALVPSAALPRAVAAASCAQPLSVTALASGGGGALLAGTMESRLYRSVDGGHCWMALPSYPSGVQIGTLLVPPGRPHTIIAGGSLVVSNSSKSYVLFRSENDGASWSSGTSGLAKTPILPVNIVAASTGTLILAFLCPQDYQFSAAHELCPQGLARSVDGGRSWQPVGPRASSMRNVVVLADGTFLAILLPSTAHTAAEAGLYRSLDDGLTWKPLTTGAGNAIGSPLRSIGGMAAFFAVPWAPSHLFIGANLQTFKATASRSTDGGLHWSVVWRPKGTEGALIEPAAVAFAGLIRSHTLLLSAWGAIYRSADGGSSWTRAKLDPPADAGAARRMWSLLAAPDGTGAYAGALDGVFRSTDDGQTWQLLSS